MREINKKWYAVRRELTEDHKTIIYEEFEGSFKTKEEAIAKARRVWDYLTDEEKRYNSITVCKFYSFQDDNGEWHSIFDILENTEYEIPTF